MSQYIEESTGDTKRLHALQPLVGESLAVICGAPNVALESLALGCRAWITSIMNVVPRSAQQLVRVVHDVGDPQLTRRIHYAQILPLVDLITRNNNPTGPIEAGVSAPGVGTRHRSRPTTEEPYSGYTIELWRYEKPCQTISE